MLKKNILAIVTLTGVCFLPTLVHADDQFLDNRWYVAPFGSYVKPGGDRNSSFDSGYGAGLGFGKIIDEHFNVELRGFYNGFDDKTDRIGKKGQWDLMGGTADVQYYLWRDTFSPYAVIAAGGMNSNVNGNSGVGILGEAGAGFTYELHDNFLLRSDVRYRYNNNLNAHLTPLGGTDEYHDMVVNVGFVVPLGPKPQPVAAAEPAVDCSTLDSDSDGVNDCIDTCPGTISGSKVDTQGCPLSLELKGVNFEYDSAQLTPSAMAILDGVAENLIAYPQKKDIEVRGHTSSEGSNKYNMRLSQKRSQSVADYLSMKGVTNRLTAHGYGEDMPIADNSTEEGKSQNRRVELVWFGE
ncbi:MAG: OmpA family protein [Methylococcaceae bacterium]|nr:OmpA family protein [Methylococcaceae bacterium]